MADKLTAAGVRTGIIERLLSIFERGAHLNKEESRAAFDLLTDARASLESAPDAPFGTVLVGSPGEIHILFDGPPGPKSGRFVETEDAEGHGINVGRWEERGDYWHLIVPGTAESAPVDEVLESLIQWLDLGSSTVITNKTLAAEYLRENARLKVWLGEKDDLLLRMDGSIGKFEAEITRLRAEVASLQAELATRSQAVPVPEEVERVAERVTAPCWHDAGPNVGPRHSDWPACERCEAADLLRQQARTIAAREHERDVASTTAESSLHALAKAQSRLEQADELAKAAQALDALDTPSANERYEAALAAYSVVDRDGKEG